jgi:diguanylate cyclase (GGDEF)-like protein
MDYGFLKRLITNRVAWLLILMAIIPTMLIFVWEYFTHQNLTLGIENKNLFKIAVISFLIAFAIAIFYVKSNLSTLVNVNKGMRNIAKGQFNDIEVVRSSELSDLTESFNNMSAYIQRQFDSLQNLSSIDREMAYKLDLNKIIKKIITRIESLCPASGIAVFRLHESNDLETHLTIYASSHLKLAIKQITIPTSEIEIIQAHPTGLFCEVNDLNRWQVKSIFPAEDSDFWVYPIFWQSELYGFIIIGSTSGYARTSTKWNEIYELAGRIGIAISTQTREEKLLIQAQYDSLTGLPNRILLQDRLTLAMQSSDRTENTFWLVDIDLDRFKSINESIGHHAGDMAIIEVSNRLKAVVHNSDTVSRFGGDEFIVILQGEMPENMRMEVLHQILKTFESPILIDQQEIILNASIGIAIYPNDGKSADQMLRNADVAMRRAKDMHQNSFQFFTRFMNKRVTDRLKMETHLRKALALNEFTLDYQAKVNLKTNQIVGMEALIRWENEVLGFVSPQHFIPLAEETGLIIPIGEWVLKTACTQTMIWQQSGFDNLMLSVNLSARQFKQKNLAHNIKNIVEETGLPANLLELELTESIIMNNVEHTMNVLNEIKTIGVKLSVDDFGTGYSSLSYLRNIPLDTIKIDKSFIDDIVTHTDHAPIVASIITLAKNLNLKVVAEGVETLEQVKYLSLRECDEIQGYYFSSPVNQVNFERMLTAQCKKNNS